MRCSGSEETLSIGVQIVVPRGPVRRWQTWVIDRLREARGARVEAVARSGWCGSIQGLELLLRLERLVYGAGGDRAGDLLAPPVEAGSEDADTGTGKVVVDLTDGTGSLGMIGPRVLTPLFDGEPGEAALVQCLLDGRLPVLGVHDSARGAPIHLGQVAIENPTVLTLALESVWSRMAAALSGYVEAVCRGDAALRYTREICERCGSEGSSRSSTALFGRAGSRTIRKLASSVAGRLDTLARGGHTWSIAYRRNPCDVACQAPATLDIADHILLPDDGQRYFADPFPFDHEGRTWIFCEELPYRTQKGLISAFAIDADGRATRPRPVLETDHHLSYPQVIADAGQLWMIPESAARGHVALYRCTRFPDQWEQVAVLIEGDLHDATVFRHDGRWWMTAASRDWQSSSWDTLAVFHAERLTGPWHACAHNPVLTDVFSARPAGVPFMSEGRLVRPAQDCSGGYGSRLTLAEVTTLSPDRLEQRVIGTVAFGAATGLLGPHTVNCAGGWALIDVYGRPAPTRV